MSSAPAPTDVREFPIVRNTLLLSGCMAVQSGALQLSAAVATITFVLVTGVDGLLGLGPAIFLSSAAVAALFAGRAMDRFGRIADLGASFLAACLALFGGFLLNEFGPAGLALLTGIAALLPMLWILRNAIRPGFGEVAGTLRSR